jgi:ribosomal protein S20
MHRKSIILTAAMVAGLMLGIIVGPTLRSMVASAQAQPPAQTQPPAAGGSLTNLFLDKLAAALKIQRSALDSAITSAGASTVDTAVQQGTLTQAQADALKARIQAGDLGALLGGRGGFSGGPQLGGIKQAMLDAAAKALKITTTELLTQLRNGQTLAQLAQAHGTTEQAVTSAALTAAKTQLDQAVTNGTLTQAQADAIYAQLQQRGAQLLTPRGPGFGGRGAPTRPQAPTAPAPTT